MAKPPARVPARAPPAPAAGGRSVGIYVAVGVAVLALIVAAYAASQAAPPAPPKAVAKVPSAVSVPAPGVHYVDAGWVYVYQPSYVQVSTNSSVAWIRLGDYWAPGPAATFAVDKGNYTLGLVADVDSGTVISLDVRVLS